MSRIHPDRDQEENKPLDILVQRARELAAPLDEVRDEEDGVEVLEFLLSGERYTIGTQFVREVALLKEITTLPGTPPFILGIISLRGSVISIVDLRKILGLPPKGLTDYNRVIVISGENMSFGVLTDVIVGTRTIRMSAISRPPPTVSGIGAAYLVGVLPGPLMVIDGKAMLTDPRMVVGND
ncbi:MAG TPA: chemotaxis protein CheW [Methanospirillum sp.]|nr:chemotaxis protein CheW [Methanospirillum sp.]